MCRATRAVFCQSELDAALLCATAPRRVVLVALKSEVSTRPPTSVMPKVKTQIAAAPRGRRATAASFLEAVLLEGT